MLTNTATYVLRIKGLPWNQPSALAFSQQLGGYVCTSSGASMSNSADLNIDRAAPVASLALERIVRSPAALVENLPIGIYTCDRDGVLVQSNRRAEELWGRTRMGGLNFRFCAAARS